MDHLLSLLTFQGRLARLDYWRGYLVIAVGTAVVWCAGLLAILAIGPWGALLLLPMPALIAGQIAIAVRRLHDRNRRGWWALPFVVFPLFMGFAAQADIASAGDALLLTLTALLSFVLSVWGFIEIGVRRGTPGENRFGPDPLPSA